MPIDDSGRRWKYGRGIEITSETLIEILRERFPDTAPWHDFDGLPAMEVDNKCNTVTLYWTRHTEPSSEWSGEFAMRRVGEGAPIPTGRIGTGMLHPEAVRDATT